MSGFSGIISLREGALIDDTVIANLSKTIEYRGNSKPNIISTERYSFIYSKLITTNRCKNDNQPYSDEDHNLSIVSNSRIDNRASIINEYNLKHDIPDSLLILELFKKLGKKCLDLLVGPFTFVIFNNQSNEIFAARDHFGQRPFYFAKTDDYFIFSSDANSILSTPYIKEEINEQRVLDYLIFQGSIDNQTFFKNIKKLHRSECLHFSNKSLKIKKYYSLPTQKFNFSNDDKYIERFSEILRSVILDQSNTCNGSIATTCSGGLDSTSIASVLHDQKINNLKLKSYSVHFPELSSEEFKKTDEKKYVNDFIEKFDADHTFINSSIDPLEHLDFIMQKSYFPPKSGNGYMHQEIFDNMKKDDINVLFDGFDGDSVVSHGLEKLDELLRSFKISELKKEVYEASRLNNRKFSLKYFFKNFILKPLIPVKLKIYLYSFTKKGITELHKYNFLNKEMKKSYDFLGKYERFYSNKSYKFTNGYESHKNGLSMPFWEEDLEMIDYLSSLNKVDIRLPFMDKRLVELCLSVPPHLKMKNGVRRYYFRESMKGICPESVLLKNTKADLGPKLRNAIFKKRGFIKEKIINYSFLKHYLDLEYLEAITTHEKNSKLEMSNIYKWYVLDKWIEKRS